MPAVVVIDDDASIRGLLKNICDSYGWTSYTARNAEEGLNLIKNYKPDAIITDVRLPGISGLNVLEAVQSMVNYRPKIFVMTGSPTEEGRTYVERLGHSYLLKPNIFDPIDEYFIQQL